MLKRLDKIRFRGPRSRDELLDLAESPPGSDNEGDDPPLRPRPLPREMEDQLRDPGHLEIALLEKHFLQEELRKLREETSVDLLRQELEKERGKRIDLEQRMNEQSPTNTRSDKPQREEWSSRLQRWWYDRFGVYMEDFRFQQEETTVEAEEPLSAKRLTENMRRLKRGARPVTNFMRNLSALSNWHSVYTSAIAFILYMNAAWHGWALPMFLFLAILRLSLNYLIARGWRIQWSIVPEVSEPLEPPKEDLTVSEKFQLVLDVAQKAQNLFGKMSDVLEKIKNIATIQCGGVPRDEEAGRSHSTKKGAFHEIFNLTESDRPLAVCENGWRCCLINRDRKMPTDYIRNGVLSSSRSSSSKKNKVIKLADITDIQKYKVLSVLPGSGMGISIATPATQKPLVFGAMIHRDEAFDAIFTQYVKIMTTTKPPANPEL
ncbi:hypothetical protein NHX12_020414 [Muraenolepis orangiensis]|uniref:GRAM domain-containing protein n=1 Tax=Muraenolepis orangiensis TaxID=630683 RepID=A0A9Q0EX20_9TELE|nr:hypothetical protein NHX12_020414 [Muraenolepis orangiensis]